MKTLNRVFLVGSVGRDPEIKEVINTLRTTVASLSLATSERHKDKAGNWAEETTWHSLVAFGRTAEVIRDYVSKGSSIHVEGRLQTQSWDDKKSGQKRYKTQIVIENLILLGSGKKAEPQSKVADASPFDNSDIPF